MMVYHHPTTRIERESDAWSFVVSGSAPSSVFVMEIHEQHKPVNDHKKMEQRQTFGQMSSCCHENIVNNTEHILQYLDFCNESLLQKRHILYAKQGEAEVEVDNSLAS